MATYKGTVGTAVVNYAGNYPGAVDGELWYDSTNKDFKYQYPNVTAAGSWRTGNDLNTGRWNLAGAGTYTAGLAFAGGEPYKNETESYNGTSWTELNNISHARRNLTGLGTSNTAALAIGGYDGSQRGYTETWNGTNWTEVNDLITS